MNCRFVVPPRRRAAAGAAARVLLGLLALGVASGVALPGRAFALSGGLDPAFDGDGKVTVAVGTGSKNDEAFALALEPDGRIVAGGYAADTPNKFAVARLQTNGALDPTFGVGGTGVAKVLVGARGEAHAVTLAPGSKIVLAGYGVVSSHDEFGVARLLTDGSPDPTFGTMGVVTVFFG